MIRLKTIALGGGLLPLVLSGCATTDGGGLNDQLRMEKERSSQLETTVSELRSKLGENSSMLSEKDMTIASYEQRMAGDATGAAMLPPNAKAGECYARVFNPPQYETTTDTVLKTEATRRVDVTKAQYDMVEKQVLVKEASTELKVIPARYEWAEERVLVTEASQRLEVVPATYEWVEEKVLVQPAYTTWKKGRGPIERIDASTGEIMCLVEVPAEYKTVRKQVQVSPPSTTTVSIPEEYKTVRKRVLVEPAKTVEVVIPAEYSTVRVKQMVEPPREIVTEIPAEYQSLTKRTLVRAGELQWKPILCETNTTPGVISKLQNALRGEGYAPGRVDGVLGQQTIDAVARYQADHGMARGKLTIETLRKLNVM